MRIGIYQKIAVLLVMDYSPRLRIKKRRIAIFVFVNAKVMMKENAECGPVTAKIPYPYLPEVNILVACDRVVALEIDAESLVI